MRLSDAMMLGSVTCRMKKANWNSCALGCAGNAIGIPNWGNVGRHRDSLILKAWPWLEQECNCKENGISAVVGTHCYMVHIFKKFDTDVCEGRMTLEALVDWVRQVEPQPLALAAPMVESLMVGVKEATTVVLW